MTRGFIVLLLMLFVTSVLSAEGDAKYREVTGLPDGIVVTHSPERVRAMTGGRSGSEYTYVYETRVRPSSGRVRIVEFGAFGKRDGKWVFGTYTGKPFTSENFAEWYRVPGATLERGAEAVDPYNWSGASEPVDGETLWYFVGEEEDGRRVKGMAAVQEVAEISEDPEVPDLLWERTATFLKELDAIPTGIKVTVTPATVEARAGDKEGWSYFWDYETRLEAIDHDLRIDEFGILIERNGKWLLPDRQLVRFNGGRIDGEHFSDWYGAADRTLRAGQTMTDPTNWSGSKKLEDFRHRWFYVGTDKDGNRFKGEAIVECKGRLRPEQAE